MSLEAHFATDSPDRRHRVEADFRLERGVLVFSGPSGVGKTLALRTVAGLLAPTQGSVVFGESVWDRARTGHRVAVHERNLAYLPQQPSLFPFTSVAGNIGFGVDKKTRDAVVEELAALVGVEELLGELPATLSGGQQQRVAIARALATQPQLLLFDEPFAALDRPARRAFLPKLRRLVEERGIAAVVVTHDEEDERLLADQVLSFELIAPGRGVAEMAAR